MRWSIIRLIWFRDLRDQLRDRRTLFMIAVLPLVLYPVLGYAALQFAFRFSERPTTIAFVVDSGEGQNFPAAIPTPRQMASHAASLSATPFGGIDHLFIPLALSQAAQAIPPYPFLVRDGVFTATEANLPPEIGQALNQKRFRLVFLEELDLNVLEERKADLIVTAPSDFFPRLEDPPRAGLPPLLQVHGRNDEHSKQAKKRLEPLLDSWKRTLIRTRLARQGLSPYFDAPFGIQEPGPASQSGVMAPRMADLLMKLFPFMLVMWALAGALYPAVDLCAGEKERGTMETLLITPSAREEIVLGKFLTIWVFSLASALLNLFSMGIATAFFGASMPIGSIPLSALFWCVVLSLPLSALFSAISLAIGAYARSSKEGQYYLMPLFLVTMPLIFLTLAPGVELNPFYSLVPVTGVALLMQKLMTAGAAVPWLYFIPVLAPIALYSWIALRWAIDQFKREDVLFREAERLDLNLYLKSLFREKEPSATLGQAYFLFVMILGLRWLATGLGSRVSADVHHAIMLIAFVATPTLIMAVMLNTRPQESLYLRWPTFRETLLAGALALLLLPPLAAAAQWVFERFPNVIELLRDRQPLMEELWALNSGQELSDQFLPYLLAFALLPALCEELAFRGFILKGLHRRFRPRTAVILSAFLFALYHLNVFAFLPAFFLGVVLGLLTVRSKSLVPAVVLHFLHNSALLTSIHLLPRMRGYFSEEAQTLWLYLIALTLLIAGILLWWLYRKPYVEKEREEARLSEGSPSGPI